MRTTPKPPASQPLQVSDHAVVRYLERGIGVDIDGLKNEMLGDAISKIKRLGDGRYPITRNCKAIVSGNIVVTVVKANHTDQES